MPKIIPKLKNQIKYYHYVTNAGLTALVLLILLTLNILVPIKLSGESALAADGTTSTTSLTIDTASSVAGVELLVTSDSGTFASTASGSEMSFNVATNNVTGYQLSIAAKSSTALTNSTAGTSFASLDATSVASGIDADTFGNASNTVYNNTWGFKPSYYKSSANSDKFYPSPTTSGVTLNKTESANTNADTYTIAIGARATYTQVAGTYTNTYILSAVGNYPQYKITYVDNTGDSTLNNMPSPNPQTTPSATGTTIKLSATKPTRTGYTFAGWCTVDNSANTSACSGTTYAAEAEFPLSTLSANNVNLYTVWTADKYTCTKQYRLQGTDASYPTNYTTDTTEQVAYGATCSYSKSETGYTTQSTSGVMNSTSGITLQVSLPRATYNVKVNFTANTGVSSTSFAASGWTTRTVSTSGNTASLAYDVQYTITPSFSNTSYELDTITLNNSSYGTLTNTSGTYYFTPNTSSGSAEITVTGKSSCATTVSGTMQGFNPCSTIANGTSGSLTDGRDNQIYTVKKINDQWWMTRNLAIGCNGSGSSYGSSVSSKSLTSSNSNVSSTWSTPTALLSTAANSSSTSGYTTAAMQCNATYGAWYNYAAASAGTITGSSNSTAATYDICPAGWHLPTGPNTTSGTDFNKLVGNTTSGWQDPTDGLKAFGAVAGGRYNNGSLSGTGYGYWWSATAGNASRRYYLNYDSSDGQFFGNGCYYRYLGFYVRCVRS